MFMPKFLRYILLHSLYWASRVDPQNKATSLPSNSYLNWKDLFEIVITKTLESQSQLVSEILNTSLNNGCS